MFYNFKLELVCKVDDENAQELAKFIDNYIYRASICIDEVDMFFNASSTSKNYIYRLIHYGRHKEIDIFSTSRRPANISRNVTSQTDIFYFSQIKEPFDLKYFRDIAGDKYLEKVQSLPPYSFLEAKENLEIRTIKND
ncbi:MAG: hypothetical protein LBQ18_05640 [Campylobacteraceae bacterium]|jgi:hypothetical protein|nr:hypothetical protein [Campylobacteraceae bacterium]